MANIKELKWQLFMPNLIHTLSPFADKDDNVINCIIEINARTINKYELITETGHLKLDRVGYSTLSYPFAYGAIPMTLDQDGDPLDVALVNVTEALVPGCLVEARVIGLIRFTDDGEVDDKVVAVLDGDKRVEHIRELKDLGEYWMREVTYYLEHYKDLKKPGTCETKGFLDVNSALEVIDECKVRYDEEREKHGID